jgi:4-amino-4-deoxychorismate synthase, component I
MLIDEAAPASSGEAYPDGSGTHADPVITPCRVPVVAIDGYSGSGKSTLAAALVSLLPGWQVLHLDDWYPGWDGLAAGAQVARRICEDLRSGCPSSYEAWDWEVDAPGVIVDVPVAPTIIEGCGAWDADADLSIWIEDPGEDERRRRALARDGATYAPHWQRWADQDKGRFVK